MESRLEKRALQCALGAGLALALAGPATAQQLATPQPLESTAQPMDSGPYAAAVAPMQGAQGGLTRQDVMADLARARSSGQIDELNRTVYKGSGN